MDLPHISVSTMESFLLCPRKAYLRKTDETIGKTQTPATQLGSAIHKTLEIYHTKGLGEFETLSDMFKVVAREYDIPDYNRFGAGIEMLDLYEQSPESKANVIQCEVEFSIEIGGFKVLGFIDRIDYNGGADYSIWDYKTSFLKKDKYELQDDLQLITYDIAFRQMWEDGEFPGLPKPETVHCGMNYLRYGAVSVTFSDEERQKARDFITYMGHRIAMIDEEPEPRLNTWCYYCDWKNSCKLYTDDYKEYLDLDVGSDIEDLALRFNEIKLIKKIVDNRNKDLSRQIMVRFDHEGAKQIDTAVGKLKLISQKRASVDQDKLKAGLIDWTKYAQVDPKMIEEQGTNHDRAVLDAATTYYEKAPYPTFTPKK